MARPVLLLGLLATASCIASIPSEQHEPLPPRGVHTWGTMREVLREGRTQTRVALPDLLGPHTVAVGALTDLAGEITVIDGRPILSWRVSEDDVEVADGVETWHGLGAHGNATLLVAAEVPAWNEHVLAEPVETLTALEESVRTLAAASGLDTPLPFRVEGTATEVRLHVLDGACPMATPDGPKPVRFAGRDEAVSLVGFFADDAAGTLTHHGRASHAHGVLRSNLFAGHLDEVRLAPGARLFLPDWAPASRRSGKGGASAR